MKQLEWKEERAAIFLEDPPMPNVVLPRKIQKRKVSPQMHKKKHRGDNLTPAARRHSVVSARYVVSGRLLTEWRDERRPRGGCRDRRFPLVKTPDMTDEKVWTLQTSQSFKINHSNPLLQTEKNNTEYYLKNIKPVWGSALHWHLIEEIYSLINKTAPICGKEIDLILNII